MIEFLPRSHDNILGIKDRGKITVRDYKDVLMPKLENLLNEQ